MLMRSWIDAALESQLLWLAARILLAVVFAASGLAKALNFAGGVGEMRAAGLEPAWAFNVATIFVLLAGSLLLLVDRAVWLGAGALSVFLLLTIVIVHRFWSLPEPRATLSLYFALEHVSIIGGLLAAAIASHLRRQLGG